MAERQDLPAESESPIFERPVTRRAALQLGAGGALLAASAGRTGGGVPKPARGTTGAGNTPPDTLVVAVEGDVDTFDPAFTVGSKPSQTTIQNVFDQLTHYEQIEQTASNPLGEFTYTGVDTESILGMLAESFEEDGDSVIFTLREGLTYHDGTPVTAPEIEFGYRRVFEGEGISFFLLEMAGVSDPDKIRALDDRRIQFDLEQANLLFMKNNTMHNTSAIMRSEVEAHAGDNDPWANQYFNQNLATGNGPFALAEYRAGDRIVLDANPNYYAGTPTLSRVIQTIVPEPTQRLLLIQRGEVDMVMIPPVKDIEALAEDPNLQVVSVPSTRNWLFEMNTAIPPFDKKQVRQAVSFAIPYTNIVNDVFRGFAQESKSLVGKGMPGSDFSFWKYDTDLQQAAELLEAAGFPNGEGAASITISIRADSEEAERTAVLIQANLREIGLDASIQKLAFAPFNEQEQGKQLQAFIDEWISWVNDPWYHLFWHVRSDSPSNYTNFANDEVDALATEWVLSTDVEGRLEASKRVQEIVIEEAPLAFLAQPNWNVVMRANVRGYAYYNDELNRYAFMSKEA